MLNEADTRAKLVDPKLHKAGWDEELITREYYFTKGRIYLIADEHRRKERKKADYLLRYRNALPLAVMEAKDESHSPAAGMQQAKAYAAALGVRFAYSTNGHGFEEFDFATNEQETLEIFPSPDELWRRIKESRELRFPKGPGGASIHSDEASGDPLLYPYYHEPGGKQPWYFQEVAITRVIECIGNEHKRVLLAMATGTGKTFVAFQIVWKLVKTGTIRRVLFLADRIILRDQAYNAFEAFGDARDTIEEGKAPRTRDIYFSIYQALYAGEEGKRLYQQYPRNFFDLIIIDECHRSGYGTWHAILKHFNTAIQLGMTATPKRDDNIDTYAYFCRDNDGNPAYAYSLGQGIDDGFLATYRVHKVRTNVDRDGLHIADAVAQGAEVYVPQDAELRDVYQMQQFEREITVPDRTKKICDHLAGLLRTFGPMNKTMVFCVNMEHAALVTKELQNQFAHLGHPDYAVRIVSEEGAEGRRLLEQFQDSDKKTPVVATTVDLLTTGVDVPSARNIVFIKPVGSQVVFKQIVGRGSRVDTVSDKYWFRVVDYTNATRLFDNWDRPGDISEPIPAGRRESFLEGFVADVETGQPVPEALITALIGPNEQVQARTGPTGQFAFTQLPEGQVTVIVTCEGYRRRQVTLKTFPNPDETVCIELRPVKLTQVEKVKVKGLTVNIAEETYLELESTGQRLTVEQYIDHSRLEVLRVADSQAALVSAWIDAEKRQQLLDHLIEHGIHVDVLKTLLKRPDADGFDILASVAFKQEVHSREERAKALENLNRGFLESFGPDAKEVLLALLDKYRTVGVEELARPEVFRTPPFDRMGYAPGVAKLFSGPEKLKSAMDQLQRRLYAIEVSE